MKAPYLFSVAIVTAALAALTLTPVHADPSTATNSCCKSNGNCFGKGARKYTQKTCGKLCASAGQTVNDCSGNKCQCSAKRK